MNMTKVRKYLAKITLIIAGLYYVNGISIYAENCSTKLFSATMDSKLSIGDVVENLADTCGLTVIVKDEAARQRMRKKLYYVKLKNSTLKGFLNTVLKDNDLHYTLNGNKLKISYLLTRTFRIHYISGQRIGKSNAHVTIANSSNSATNQSNNNNKGGTASKTGITIESNDEFRFWKTVESEVQRILIGAADGSTHYTKSGKGWEGPDGKIWEYNPLAPIVNPEAGMITVTGTDRQVTRVAQYIKTLSKQIKSQVLIDVRILTVTFENSKTTGVDWSQLYTLQNMTLDTVKLAAKNISGLSFDKIEGVSDYTPEGGVEDPGYKVNAGMVQAIGHTQITEVIKFLGTQGDVKSISSPRVMTLSNQPALISVGKELFYKIQSSTTSSTGGGTTASQGELVDSVFAGILLDITPEIDNNGMITLKINPSISETVNTLKNDGSVRSIPPDLVRRQIASVIKVRDGEHAILGGLISSKSGMKVNKVPLLGDIPLLEYAFKYEEKIDTVEELVLIITPHIVNDSKDISLKDLGYTKLNEK